MLLAYREFETGSLSRHQFEERLTSDFNIPITTEFQRVMNDDRRTYLSLLKSLHISTRRIAEPTTNYYESARNQTVRCSTDLTTAAARKPVPADQKQHLVAELSKSTKDFLEGRVSSGDFLTTLRAHNVPLTPQIQKGVREHEISQGGQFRSLGQAVLTAIK